MHSCFTNSIFAARTLDFKVKFGFVFRSEAEVFRRYVLALLSVGLLRKFEAYPVYLSLIRSFFLRCFSFFQKFLHFTYMLLWFRLIIPSFPAQIDDMRSRFSALSALYCQGTRTFLLKPQLHAMHKALGRPWVGVRLCHLLLLFVNLTPFSSEGQKF